MQDLEIFVNTLDTTQQDFFWKLHSFLLDIFPFKIKIRYKIPFYDDKIWICYLNPLKKGGFELCFLDGYLLSNAQNLLESRGRKRIKGIIITENTIFPSQAIIEIIHEVLLIQKLKK
ncbi:MAG: hypothetical protein EAZ06_11585 [Cytophagales bacterium]|nr:MAG: hypothetical protein EAY69_10975 [Cytophagales bacterium]TAH28019.1 MAG: hypothetical protein EAZ06_11585 [Cytophagales bacterium]